MRLSRSTKPASLIFFGSTLGGTGVLPSGAIHPDLVKRLADEAAKSASHVLSMCIRALDYLPPVDVTFFEYLRALITADFDLVRDDRHNYRVAFVEAFRRRGIYPTNLYDPSSDKPRTLSVDTLRWQGLDQSHFPSKVRVKIKQQYGGVIERLKRYADACLYLPDREKLFMSTRTERLELHRQLRVAFAAVPESPAAWGAYVGKNFGFMNCAPRCVSVLMADTSRKLSSP